MKLIKASSLTSVTSRRAGMLKVASWFFMDHKVDWGWKKTWAVRCHRVGLTKESFFLNDHISDTDYVWNVTFSREKTHWQKINQFFFILQSHLSFLFIRCNKKKRKEVSVQFKHKTSVSTLCWYDNTSKIYCQDKWTACTDAPQVQNTVFFFTWLTLKECWDHVNLVNQRYESSVNLIKLHLSKEEKRIHPNKWHQFYFKIIAENNESVKFMVKK